jgi:hypothetical protein
MSLSATKKIGIYLPFKTNKTSEEAIQRLVRDCKKFGVKFMPYFEEQQLIHGYGESVCFLIDDLLNRELIRRDYKFEEPLIPNDSDEEDDLEEIKFEEENIINFVDNVQDVNSPTKRRKVVAKNAIMRNENGKVTKTNFFSNTTEGQTQADEEGEMNDSMIS